MNNDMYFKLGGNKYEIIIPPYYLISFDFTSLTNFLLTYVTRVGGDTIYGEYKIIDSRIYLETSSYSHQYNATDWYITKVNDENIVVKFKGTSYTLDKK